MHEAKTHLSRLLREVAAGEEVTITRDGVAVAKLVPVARTPSQQWFGRYEGVFEVPEDFDEPLPAEMQQYFE